MSTLADILESNITRTVLAALAIGVTLGIYLLNKRRKSLSYRIVSKTKLLSVDEAIGGRVQILLDGEPAANLGLVLIDVENTGNEPIRSEDFVRPLVFLFPARAAVISAEITKAKPSNLGATVSFDSSSVTLAPTLMNPADSVSLKVLLKQFD
jgi:hypothetical protein